MSREFAELIRIQQAKHQDRQEMQRRKRASRSSDQKLKKSRKRKAQEQESRRLLASEFRLALEGWVNVSDGAILSPRYQEQLMISTAPTSSSTRSSCSLRSVLFRIMPPAIWSVIFRDLDLTLSARHDADQLEAEQRRQDPACQGRSRYSNSSYRPLTESQFWRLWATIVHACRSNQSSIQRMYRMCPDVPTCTSQLRRHLPSSA